MNPIPSIRLAPLAALLAGALLAAPGPAAAQASAPAGAASAARPAVVKDDGKAKETDVADKPARASRGDVSEGKVAHYGAKFNGRRTAYGERFSASALTMAHNTLPPGTMVRVTNKANGKSVVVRVNDRGPQGGGRVGDVTTAAAKRLGMTRAGVVDAKLEVVGAGRAARRKP